MKLSKTSYKRWNSFLVSFTDKKKGGCRWTITHTHTCLSKFVRELVIWNTKLAFCEDKIKMLNTDSCDTDEEISCYNVTFDSSCTGDIWHQTISHRIVITKCIRKAWSFQLYVSMVRRNIECELGSIVCSDKKGSIKKFATGHHSAEVLNSPGGLLLYILGITIIH